MQRLCVCNSTEPLRIFITFTAAFVVNAAHYGGTQPLRIPPPPHARALVLTAVFLVPVTTMVKSALSMFKPTARLSMLAPAAEAALLSFMQPKCVRFKPHRTTHNRTQAS
jgi:hypothetical protein